MANFKNSCQRATFITLTLFVSNCLERITKMCSWVTIGEHFAVQWLGAGMKVIVLCRLSSVLVFCSYLCLFLVIQTTWTAFLAVSYQGGTSQISCTLSWSYSECCAASGLSQCGIVCTSATSLAFLSSWRLLSSETWS